VIELAGGNLVSAAGLEPATHALKERMKSRLPRIFNNLRSPESLKNSGEGWWSGLNHHLNKHSALGCRSAATQLCGLEFRE
jgi:hypothetical protein